jgi:hypothetical protein
MQTLANRSRIKSDKLRAVEDATRQLQEKDCRIGEKIMKNVELRNELNTLKTGVYPRGVALEEGH